MGKDSLLLHWAKGMYFPWAKSSSLTETSAGDRSYSVLPKKDHLNDEQYLTEGEPDPYQWQKEQW